MEEVAKIVRKHGIRLIQNTAGLNLRGGHVDGAARIASHYQYSLTQAFDIFSESPAIVIVEDDLLFSPDFMEYFEAIAPVLEIDATLFAVSAWNDNGFIGMYVYVCHI